MKRKSLTKVAVILITSVFSLTYLFLIPLARVQTIYAQEDILSNPPVTQPKTVSKLYIPTGASTTLLKESSGNTALLIQDHLTSTRVVETGKATQNQEYYPYGTTNGEANTTSDKQFTSHRKINDTGVYHAGARFYNPQMGIFISADKVQGPNRYMYAGGNPTIHTDPSGKIIPLIIAAIIIGGAAFGAGFGTGYEQSSQEAEYGSVQDPTAVVVAGLTGGVAGAGAGYMGAVAIPAAIGAISTGAGAASAVGLVGGAQIGVGACMSNSACLDAVETGAQVATGSDLPPIGGLPRLPTKLNGIETGYLDWRNPSSVLDDMAYSEIADFMPDPFGFVKSTATGEWLPDHMLLNTDIHAQDEMISNAIVRMVESKMPYSQSQAQFQAADAAMSMDELINTGSGVCRHNSLVCAGVASRIWGNDSSSFEIVSGLGEWTAPWGENIPDVSHMYGTVDTGFYKGYLDATGNGRAMSSRPMGNSGSGHRYFDTTTSKYTMSSIDN